MFAIREILFVERCVMREDVANFIEDLSQRDFIVFAGAGIAKPTGIPDWKGLLKALADEQPLRGIDIDNVEECLNPEVAQMLFTLYEINGKVVDYYRIIRQKLESKTASHMPVQRKIIKGGGSVITTNLDTTFEAAFKEEFKDIYHLTGKKEKYNTQSLHDLCAEKAKTRKIIKSHNLNPIFMILLAYLGHTILVNLNS